MDWKHTNWLVEHILHKGAGREYIRPSEPLVLFLPGEGDTAAPPN